MKRILSVTALVTMLYSSSTHAHHSYGAYYENKTVTIEGTIESLRFANPHVTFELRTDAGDIYTAEWREGFELFHKMTAPWLLKVSEAGFHGEVRELQALESRLDIVETKLYGSRIPEPGAALGFTRQGRIESPVVEMW